MKQKLSLIALLLSVVLMAMPAFAAAATEATEATTEASSETAATEASSEAAATEASSEAAAEETEATEAESAEAASTATEATEAAATEATEAASGSPEVTAETPADAAATAVTTSAPAPAAPPAVNAEAKALYDRAMAKLENVTSIEMKGSARTIATVGGETVDQLMGVAIREIIKDDDLQMEVSMHDPDGVLLSEVYYKDGYYYQRVGDLRAKSKMDLKNMEAMSYEINTQLTDDMFAGATMETLENGNVQVTCTISADAMNEATADVLGGMMSGLEVDATVSYGDVRYSMEFDSAANLVSYRQGFAATITADGETVVTNSAIAMNVVGVNHLTAIAYPVNLSAYVEA